MTELRFFIQIDGYGNLNPFGIVIHGGMDGYSRKIYCLKLQIQITTLKWKHGITWTTYVRCRDCQELFVQTLGPKMSSQESSKFSPKMPY